MSCDKRNGEETGLFVRPMTFFITHVLFPIITLANVGWGYWMTCDALAGEIVLKAKVLLWASVALPCLGLAAFLFRRRRIPTAVLSAFLILGVAYLYFGFRSSWRCYRKARRGRRVRFRQLHFSWVFCRWFTPESPNSPHATGG